MSTFRGDSARRVDPDEPDETTSRTSSAIRSEPSEIASDSSPTVPAVQSHPPSPASAVVEETPNDVLKRVCKESLMRGTKRNIRLVARDSWLPEFLSWRELDADSYSRNGHPPNKLILVRNSGEVEIRNWKNTPCRYGKRCKAQQCFFKHDREGEVEIAAGSALRLRQIKQAFERRRQEKEGTRVNF